MRLILSSILFGMVALAWCESPATLYEVQLATEKAKQDLQDEEKIWADEKNREAENEKNRKAQFVKLNEEKLQLIKQTSSLDIQINQKINEIELLKSQDNSIQSALNILSKSLIQNIHQFNNSLKNPFPTDAEKRKESVHLLEKDLTEGAITPEEAFNRLWAGYDKERTLAGESEFYSGSVSKGNKSYNVQYLRLGKQLLVYASSEGSLVGILKKDTLGYKWLKDEQIDYKTRESIRLAVSTAEGKSPPGFVSLPLWKGDFK